MMRLTFRRLVLRVIRLAQNDQILLTVLAVVAGAGVGGAVIVFREAIVLVHGLGYGAGHGNLATVAAGLPAWRVALLPVAGGTLVGLLIHFVMPGRRPQTVSDVIAASALHGGRMDWRTGLWSALLSATSIGTGASVGREGPAVHLGASLTNWLTGPLNLTRPMARTVLGCGTAAAVAASFNAPIAGALFANEVILGHYALTAFAPVVVASVVATIVSRGWFGNYPAFFIPGHAEPLPAEFAVFAVVGVLAGGLALAFMKTVNSVEDKAAASRLPAPLRPVLAGGVLGGLALGFPHVLGVGYEATDTALRGGFPLGTLAVLLVAKMAATSLCLGLGFSGGVFSPSLTMGALLGALAAAVVQTAYPALGNPTVYALVGMGGVASAVLGAPISTILIIFEITADYQVTVGVMLAVVTANLLTRQWEVRSYFLWQLRRRGVDLRAGYERGLLHSLTAGPAMRTVESVGPGTPMPAIRRALQQTPRGELFVTTADGVLFGTITLADLDEAAYATHLDPLLRAIDVARRHPPVVAENDDLQTCVDTMLATGREHIPVVDHADTHHLVGCLHQADALLTYNRALARRRAEERGEVRPVTTPFPRRRRRPRRRSRGS